MKIIDKVAFLVHEPVMYAHYSSVWAEMDRKAFVIVLLGSAARLDGQADERTRDFLNKLATLNYEVVSLDEIVRRKIKYRFVISNHIMGGSTTRPTQFSREQQRQRSYRNWKWYVLNTARRAVGLPRKYTYEIDPLQYLPLQAGIGQIRFMYGADISDGWSLDKWNEIYDLFLCHGVNDEREIKKRFKGETFIMGYPRYDGYFSGEMDLSRIKSEFGLSESRKTVLWMPTLGGEYSSIPLFAEPLLALSEKYNLVVRPHPLSFVQEKEFISLLEDLNFKIDRNAVRDMNELFGVADVILADNGGTPFSAIFLGRNVVFLEVPEAASTSYFAESSVVELKKHLPVISHQDIHKLENMLDSEEFYSENKRSVEALYKKYFDSPRGGGAKRVADLLGSLK